MTLPTAFKRIELHLARSSDDEAGYRFGAHVFAPGEYLTLRDPKGDHTLKVISVDRVA
jgi:hypothetical protein